MTKDTGLIGMTVQRAVQGYCEEGLTFFVDQVETKGQPPDRVKVWGTLHFTSGRFCCGEPGCHLWLDRVRRQEVADEVRKALHLTQPLEVEFEVQPNYHQGVSFHYGEDDDEF